jgi:hypothetical protein
MSNPYLANVNFDVTGSISVQNRLNANGGVSTYLYFKPGMITDAQIRGANASAGHYGLAFRINDVEMIGALTQSLAFAYGSKTITGSF